jgi:hypothetical protein
LTFLQLHQDKEYLLQSVAVAQQLVLEMEIIMEALAELQHLEHY